MFACVDGERVPFERASVPLAERSVLQADAVFEVLRTYEGRPHAFEAHLTRLRGSCARVGLSDADVSALRAETLALLAEAGEGDWAVRLWIGARGAPGMARVATDTRRAVLLTPVGGHPVELYQEGAEVVTHASASPPPSTHGAKTTNYLSSIVATTRARKQEGAHEVIRLGPHGEVLEGGSSSVFLLDERGLATPPLTTGILPGITRQVVLRLGAELGLPARERLITCHDLYRATEVMLTSSIREVMPVVRVDGLPVGDGRPGEVGRRLLEAYRRDALQA